MTLASSSLWPRLPSLAATPYLTAGAGSLWLDSPALRGVNGSGDSTPLPRPSGATLASSIADTIYGQIHLLPRLVATGLLISSENRTVVLWNATFQTVELEQIGENQPAGSQLAGFAPQSILPTGELRGTLSVTAAGPAQQRTVYTFVTSKSQPTLTVTASRVLLFPFWPDWGAEVSMEYAFDTVIARGDSGGEQRRPLALRPLRSLRATVWGDGLAGQRMRNLIQQGKDRVFGAPIWPEVVNVSAVEADGTGVTLAEDISTRWNLTRLCDMVMLHDTAHNAFHAVSITSVDTNSRRVTFSASLAGLSLDVSRPVRLIPLFLGVLASAEPTPVTDDLETWAVAFQEVAGSQPALLAAAATPSETGFLWPHRPDWNEPPSANTALLRTMRTVRGGIMEVGSRQAKAPASLTQGYLLQRAELTAFLDRVTALRGRWGRCALHEPRQAFTLTREALPNETELHVRDNGFAQAQRADAPRVRIWIRLPRTVQASDNVSTLLRRQILQAVPGNPGELVLHLDQPHGVIVPKEAQLGREYVARLDTDTVRVQYVTPTVSRCVLPFYELVGEEG